MSVAGKTVLIAGATSASGRAVASALLEAGARVVSVGSNAERLTALAAELPGVTTELADLTDEADVFELALRVRGGVGRVDGVIHLVGGWIGGGGLAGQTDADYRTLERGLTALRHVSRVFNDELLASPAGRLAIVSAAGVLAPTAGNANYVAVKAASEAWARAVAQGFGRAAASTLGQDGSDAGTGAAAVIFRVKALAGLEAALAASVVDLWNHPAAELNGTEIAL